MRSILFHLFVTTVAIFCCSMPSQAARRPGGSVLGRGMGRGSFRRGGTNFNNNFNNNNKKRYAVRPPPAAFWFRTVDDSNIQQKAYASSGPWGDRAIVFTLPQGLGVLGLSPSAAVYDFSDETNPTTLVKTGRRCFIVPTTDGLTFANVSKQIRANDGTTVTADLPQQLLLNSVGMKGTATEKRELQRNTPSIRTLCPGDLFRTKQLDADTRDFFTALHPTTSVVTLDSTVTVILPNDPQSATGSAAGRKPKRKVIFV